MPSVKFGRKVYPGIEYVMITEIYSINMKCSHLHHHQVICSLEIK